MNNSIRQALQLSALGLALACGACKHDDTESYSAKADEPDKLAVPVSDNDNGSPSIGDNLSQRVTAAVADLSNRTGIAVDAITVTEASFVNWGSAAVGCPKAGMNYTQSIVPGVLLLLEAGGNIYRYHGRSKGELFHCPDGRAEAPAYGSGQEFM